MEGQPSNLKAENMAIRLPNESVEEKLRGDSVANRITELVEERIRGNSTRTEFDAAEEKIVRGGSRDRIRIKLNSTVYYRPCSELELARLVGTTARRF